MGTARLLLAASMAAMMLIAPGCATTKPQAEPALKKAAPEPPSQAAVAPKLVVLIVLDQLGSWVLDQQLPLVFADTELTSPLPINALVSHKRLSLQRGNQTLSIRLVSGR